MWFFIITLVIAFVVLLDHVSLALERLEEKEFEEEE